MAFFLNKTGISSHFRSHSQLLAEDPSLKPFKSYKKSVSRIKRIGDVLTIVVVAAYSTMGWRACCSQSLFIHEKIKSWKLTFVYSETDAMVSRTRERARLVLL
ncbi:succinate dehydrogenase subunit 7A, mitochondrial-like isoform X3 [Prosopis cineraria]|uniref:succinate dehydrogenase subunit 7A, mitochondrial-like isoform X3 n=1 Tax=Prosopis cineraria TaxID=364024 RepID=UPI00240F2DA1|nr:succinate dehydrogenase subunit 7A, mitochondrial-like isoform X3 [Prosopis cineraria]